MKAMAIFDTSFTPVARMVDGEIYTITGIKVRECKTRDGAQFNRIDLVTDKGTVTLPPRLTKRLDDARGDASLEDVARDELIGKTVRAEYRKSQYGNEYIAVYEEGGTGE